MIDFTGYNFINTARVTTEMIHNNNIRCRKLKFRNCTIDFRKSQMQFPRSSLEIEIDHHTTFTLYDMVAPNAVESLLCINKGNEIISWINDEISRVPEFYNFTVMHTLHVDPSFLGDPRHFFHTLFSLPNTVREFKFTVPVEIRPTISLICDMFSSLEHVDRVHIYCDVVSFDMELPGVFRSGNTLERAENPYGGQIHP